MCGAGEYGIRISKQPSKPVKSIVTFSQTQLAYITFTVQCIVSVYAIELWIKTIAQYSPVFYTLHKAFMKRRTVFQATYFSKRI